MFTGIIEAVGQVTSLTKIQGDLRVGIRASAIDWSAVGLGDSIATNGVCLTVTGTTADGFTADVSVETLAHTTIGGWQVGQPVNLEQALMPTSRLGGHFVSGHVDAVGEVIQRARDARSERFTLRAPAELARYIAHKGSITVDGTSLTVNAVTGCDFALNIVPHTLDHTIIGQYAVGSRVNLEVDLIARYLERLLQPDLPRPANLSAAFLAEHGFIT